MKRRRDSGEFLLKDLKPPCASLPFCDGLPLVQRLAFFKEDLS